ncbi:MAG TPA: hypothetical protein VHO25_22545 [Polyangiaceae bacterium]|nr:hypothetical protein [Polyangiaceae bacterium]
MSEPSDVLHDATALIARMRRGLRRDVQGFVDQLDRVALHVALSRPIPDVAIGTRQQLEDEITLAPHLLMLNESWVVALFSDKDQVETVGQYMNWTTGDASLDICTLPARVGFELALQIIDENRVIGLVLNPGDDSEVFLTRTEAASIAAGKAIPLVGYVQEIGNHDGAPPLVAELDKPLSSDLIRPIEAWIDRCQFAGYKLQQTFDADRDLEPHLTLRVLANGKSVDPSVVAPLLAELEGKIPAPGYIDVVFD